VRALVPLGALAARRSGALRWSTIISEQNIALVRESYEAFERRDLGGLLDRFPADFEVHDPPEMLDSGVHCGREAIAADWAHTFEAFEDFRVEVEEQHEASEELVMFVRYSGRGRASGAVVDAPMAHVWTFEQGRPIRLRQFLDRAAALEAAGLHAV
jgi:ketosteroid isomerase-like protein